MTATNFQTQTMSSERTAQKPPLFVQKRSVNTLSMQHMRIKIPHPDQLLRCQKIFFNYKNFKELYKVKSEFKCALSSCKAQFEPLYAGLKSPRSGLQFQVQDLVFGPESQACSCSGLLRHRPLRLRETQSDTAPAAGTLAFPLDLTPNNTPSLQTARLGS